MPDDLKAKQPNSLMSQPVKPKSNSTPTTFTQPNSSNPQFETVPPTPPVTAPLQSNQNSPVSTVPPAPKTVFSAYQNPLDYQNLLRQLNDASQTGKSQKQLLKKLQTVSGQNENIANEAKAVSDKYASQIARVGELGAGAVAGNLSTGTNIVGSGNAAIASQSASQRMSALSEAQQAALQGTQQQLTANDQQANALYNALSGANTQQAQTITGLSNTTNYAQPVQVAPGSTLFTPTGEQVAGGLGGYVNYQTAEQVMGLISQYPDAGYRYNENLSPQQNLELAQNAIKQSPNYQRGTFGVAGANSYIGGQQLGAAGQLTQQASQIQTQGAGS
jgi:hypothetical protein